MKVAFISNYLNHHQLPFCLKMHDILGEEFKFIATKEMRQERIDLGYPDLNRAYPFVIRYYEDSHQKEIAMIHALEADVTIIGSAPPMLVAKRLKKRCLTFVYSERIYKSGYQKWKWPIRAWRFWRQYGRHKNCYLLCASAYTAGDFARTYTFVNKAYKWGYFPQVKEYDNIASLIAQKKPASIMWAGRFIDWKHPEHVIEVAKRLKADGYAFVVNMLGNGVEQDRIAQMIHEYDLQEYVILRGVMPPEEVRTYMEQSQVYLFTSDRNEGWGAVLNESMNSGCAVVASDAIGAVPFLMDNEQNGLIYHSGDVEDLYQKVKYLLDNPDVCRCLGENAYTTMTEKWNAESAAERLITLSERLLQGERHPYPYTDGPCSMAEIIEG